MYSINHQPLSFLQKLIECLGGSDAIVENSRGAEGDREAAAAERELLYFVADLGFVVCQL